MSSRLAVIKGLRDKGASIRMIDDVAAYVGSYENPAFVATVELIIKIRNMEQSVSRDQEQIVSLSDDDDVKNINFSAAKVAIQNDDEMTDGLRKKMLQHLAVVENSKDSYIEANKARGADEGEMVRAATSKDRKSRESKGSKNALIDKFNKLVSQITGQKQGKQQQDNILRDQSILQTKLQQQQRSQQQQATQTRSIMKMNLLKMKLMSVLKVKKDTSIYGDEQWRQSQVRPEMKPAVLSEKPNTKSPTKTNQELLASQSIDQIIKADKPKNTVAEQAPVEKGKFTQQHGEKTSQSRGSEEAAAKMAAQEAIAKLQQSGMRSSSADASPANKAEVDKQLAQNQAQQATQKQR